LTEYFDPIDKVKVLIDDKTGRWVKFLKNPTRMTLREFYRKKIDENWKLTDAQKTMHKTRDKDPTQTDQKRRT